MDTEQRNYQHPNPLGVYSRTKLEGERAVQAVGGRHLIFRLCWVYGTRGNNFLLTMQRLARERETLRVVNDQFGAPTWARPIAEAVATISRPLLAGDVPGGLSGIYHLACAERTSWHGFASRIVERRPESERKARMVTPIATADYPPPAQRPSWSVRDCSKLQRTFGIRLPDWEQALELAVKSS